MNNLYLGLVILFGLVTTVLLLRLIFSSSSTQKVSFESIDGTKFSNEKECNEYNFLYERLQFLYQEKSSSNQRKRNATLGLNLNFVKQLKTNGFSSLNSLIQNKDQFRKLAELLDASEMANDSGN